MLVPNKHGTSRDYRFGFQGQEMDNELKGDGNSLNYTFRMHDPRVGRFFAVDPLDSKYPFYSPYQFSSNSPIYTIELEGLESRNLINESEKKEHGAVKTFFVERILDLLDLGYNAYEVLNGRPPQKYPIADPNYGSKALDSEKKLFNETFSLMGTWELAKYGIGNLEDNISFSKSTFGAVNTELSTIESSMSLTQKVQTRLNFVVKKYSSLVEKYGSESIDFNKSVYEQKISGTGLKTKDLVQWREPGNNTPSPFFTFEGENPSTLGIPKTYTQKYWICK